MPVLISFRHELTGYSHPRGADGRFQEANKSAFRSVAAWLAIVKLGKGRPVTRFYTP